MWTFHLHVLGGDVPRLVLPVDVTPAHRDKLACPDEGVGEEQECVAPLSEVVAVDIEHEVSYLLLLEDGCHVARLPRLERRCEVSPGVRECVAACDGVAENFVDVPENLMRGLVFPLGLDRPADGENIRRLDRVNILCAQVRQDV